jgi:hypothetical protein
MERMRFRALSAGYFLSLTGLGVALLVTARRIPDHEEVTFSPWWFVGACVLSMTAAVLTRRAVLLVWPPLAFFVLTVVLFAAFPGIEGHTAADLFLALWMASSVEMVGLAVGLVSRWGLSRLASSESPGGEDASSAGRESAPG